MEAALASIFIFLVEKQGIIVAILVVGAVIAGIIGYKKQGKKENSAEQEILLRKEWADTIKDILAKVSSLAEAFPTHSKDCAVINKTVSDSLTELRKDVDGIKGDVVEIKEDIDCLKTKSIQDSVHESNDRENAKELQKSVNSLTAIDLKEELKEIKRISLEINNVVTLVSNKLTGGGK